MKKLLIATGNPGKLVEIAKFLSDLSVKLVSLSDIGFKDDFKERWKTYRENSQKKALFYAKKSGLPTIADDGGIEIDVLYGAPGVRSRRWFGQKLTDEQIINHMKKLTSSLPNKKRGACFRTIVSFALPNGKVWSAEGKVKGIIAKKPILKRLKGYPYRSFFYLPKIKKYYHEQNLSEAEEKLYNHRYKAIQKLKSKIKNAIDRIYSSK